MEIDIDETILDSASRAKLEALGNEHVVNVIEEFVGRCKPAKVTVIDDSDEDVAYVRKLAKDLGEEKPLAIEGHTIHYDGYRDQARDKKSTKVLIPPGMKLSKHINVIERQEGLDEVLEIADGIMEGKECLVRFFCLGPTDSRFSICALQLTDSAYVAHSEDILYRQGYEQFKKLGGSDDFFYFIHSAGRLDERGSSADIENRRIYIDLMGNRVITLNNQYAGNSLGLKKLALRLAIKKSHEEDWLCEHMFVMGVKPLDKERITYFTGAFPSACGKTSTAMVPGNTIIGDDIAYLKPDDEGYCRAANVEKGIFGIIKDVNPEGDPEIFGALTSPRELIFSNVLVKDGTPYWLGMGRELPESGENHSGEWYKGKEDENGNEITPSHKNARYTLKINDLENADPKADDSDGVRVRGFIYGGRDSDTSPPVRQSLSWSHGVYIGAALESETTSATLGKEGVRVHNPMSNIDFLCVPLSTYIKNHLKFGDELANNPLIFATNYFLKGEDGNYLNSIPDKKVWLLWMEGRVHDEYGAIETPVGHIPIYGDIQRLFKEALGKDYTQEEYDQQFAIRVDKMLAKLDRIEAIYREEEDIPGAFLDHLTMERKRLQEVREKFGKDVILPNEFERADDTQAE